MSRIPNHFIFSIESVGMMEPGVIVAEALKVLKEKCERVSGLADDASAMGEWEEDIAFGMSRWDASNVKER